LRALALLCVATLFAAQAAEAVISFTQLEENVFVVKHRVKVIGLRSKAIRLVHQKSASVCMAAGYTHMEILEQESDSGESDDSVNASMKVAFYLEDGDERVGCEQDSTSDYIKQARTKLTKIGYRPPGREAVARRPAAAEPPLPAAEPVASGEGDPETGSCTIEQIAAMARAGLTDEQIKAACLR
jgi:hypothetical protein